MAKFEAEPLPEGTNIPNHIAVVLDGNGRWARARNLPATNGHVVAAKRLQATLQAVRNYGVHTITLWGFSTENWKRPPKEVEKILKLVAYYLEKTLGDAMEEGIRFYHLGRKDRLPESLLKLLKETEERTKHNSNYILNLALDYGGRDEIVRAIRKLVSDKIDPDKIDEQLISSYLDTAGQPYPDPDLFIRPSGEQRTSGFMPWQLTYSEFYFEQVHLPDLSPEKVREAILDYSCRRRRFGGKDHAYHFKFEPELTAKSEIAWWKLANVPEDSLLRDYLIQHLQEKYRLSKDLTRSAAKYMLGALLEKDHKKWAKCQELVGEFYHLIRSEIKLALNPTVVAALQVKLWQELDKQSTALNIGALENIARQLIAETYRISLLQASKTAHFGVLANVEKVLAVKGQGDYHWDRAEEYLQKHYFALKECVA